MIFLRAYLLGDYVVVCPVAINGAKYGLIRWKNGGTPTGKTHEREVRFEQDEW
jgi:hypothetical protein